MDSIASTHCQIASYIAEASSLKQNLFESVQSKTKDIINISDYAQKISTKELESRQISYITSDILNAKKYYDTVGQGFLTTDFLCDMSSQGTFITISAISSKTPDVDNNDVILPTFSSELLNQDGTKLKINFNNNVFIK